MNDEAPQSTPDVLRSLPHALGPEKSVLSSMMQDPGLLAERPLDPEIFYLPAHRTIYQFMSAGPEFELVSFVQRLHDRGKLEAVGGPAAITDIYTYAPNSAYFEQHLTIIRRRYARRLAIKACQSAVDAAYDTSEGEYSDNFLEALSGPVSEVFDAAAAITPPRDTKAQAKEFLERWEKKLRGEKIAMGIPTGIPNLDHHLRGIHEQHMGIISARSGGGKSTLGTQIAVNLAVAGTGVLYLCLERSDTSVFDRAVIQTAGIHHAIICDPQGWAKEKGYDNPDKITLADVRQALTKLVESNFHLIKPSDRQLATQCAVIRRYVRLHGVKVVFLDQIGLVKGKRQHGDNEETEKRGVSNTLQELAHELRITIIVMSQVTEDGDTKGARAIEEDCDWRLLIVQERDRKKENFGEHQHVLFAKHSHNPEAEGQRLPLILDPATLRFVHGYPKSAEEKKPKNRFEK